MSCCCCALWYFPLSRGANGSYSTSASGGFYTRDRDPKVSEGCEAGGIDFDSAAAAEVEVQGSIAAPPNTALILHLHPLVSVGTVGGVLVEAWANAEAAEVVLGVVGDLAVVGDVAVDVEPEVVEQEAGEHALTAGEEEDDKEEDDEEEDDEEEDIPGGDEVRSICRWWY